MLLHFILAKYLKLLQFNLMEIYCRVIALSAQIGSKGTNGHAILQGLLKYVFVVVLAIFVKVDDLSTFS